MKHDENENITQSFSPQEILKGIFISNLPSNFQIKQIYQLFSKAGEIESLYHQKNSMIIIYCRSNSAEMAMIYDHFKFGVSDDEIKVLQLKELENNQYFFALNDWKEEKEFMKKQTISNKSKYIEPSSIRSSITSQHSFNESFDNLHSKMVKKLTGIMRDDSTSLNENEGLPQLSLKKYEENINMNLSIIKEDLNFAEKSTPISNNRLQRNYSKESNKENEILVKNKSRISQENMNFFPLEKKDSKTLLSENFISKKDSLKKSLVAIQEEDNNERGSNKKMTENENKENFSLRHRVESHLEFFDLNEPVEKIFQPLKNFKTSIGKYYKYEDVVRDFILNKVYFRRVFLIWIVLYIYFFISNNIL